MVAECSNCGRRGHITRELCVNTSCIAPTTHEPHIHRQCRNCYAAATEHITADDLRPVLEAARAELHAKSA